MDYWVEGPSYEEPAGHLSINVGNPMGTYFSFSFGINGECCAEGQVYFDIEQGGEILPGYYMQTSKAEDKIIMEYLFSLLGNKNFYMPWNTCRNFSIDQFNIIQQYGYGKPGTPPTRPVPENSNSPDLPLSVSTIATDGM